jgi:ADP-ribose pyrophosphatase YjhB (NUDIX family)
LLRAVTLAGWRFCPRCRGELEIGPGRAECKACGFVTYASSAPTASAVCVDDRGRVLLARRANPPYRNYWDLPGGFLEEGEHPLEALRRELREETGLEIEPLEFLGVFMDRYGAEDAAPATLNLYWTARIVGGELEAADDVSELRWFSARELPWNELAFQSTPDVLSAWRRRQEDA